MADAPRYPDSKPDIDDDTGVGPDRGSPPNKPRWLKVSGIVIGVLVVPVVIVVGVLTRVGGPH